MPKLQRRHTDDKTREPNVRFSISPLANCWMPAGLIGVTLGCRNKKRCW